jgi:hypothetical protein
LKARLTLLFTLLVLFSTGLVAGSSVTSPEAIVENYAATANRLSESLDGSSMEVEIHASLPKLKKKGRLHALRHISKLGKITYEHLIFEGDGTVKNQVIARYLAAEVEAQKDPSPTLAVTPANYKFTYKGLAQIDGRSAHVFAVAPKKKSVGLFKGEVWIDTATNLRVQESGYWVKNPSVFLKKVAFMRKYEIRDGISVPLQVASVVDTRVWGPAELEIDFSNFSVDAPPAVLVSSDGQ